jgi:NTP pyrophosphatase (non-canonical NTP hydrolase)
LTGIYTLLQYQSEAIRTFRASPDTSLELAILGLGIAGESGEVADHIKKLVGHGHEFDIPKIREELGDVLWYIAAIAHVLDMDLEDIANENVAKLRARYPEGFSEEASRNRTA